MSSVESRRTDLQNGLRDLVADYGKIVLRLGDAALGSVELGHLLAELAQISSRGVALEALAARLRRQLQLAQR
jgi:hypothetical protein